MAVEIKIVCDKCKKSKKETISVFRFPAHLLKEWRSTDNLILCDECAAIWKDEITKIRKNEKAKFIKETK